MNPFEYLKAINETKKDIMVDDVAEKQYNPFIINRGLSFFKDTILYANEMNRYTNIDSKLQYDFLRTLIRKRKRFSKWTKEDKNSDIDLIKEYYGYSKEKAFQVLPLLSKDQLAHISKKLSKGGRKP